MLVNDFSKNDPRVKDLLRYKKIYLVSLAEYYGVESTGSKSDLAIKVAKAKSAKFAKDWKTISS